MSVSKEFFEGKVAQDFVGKNLHLPVKTIGVTRNVLVGNIDEARKENGDIYLQYSGALKIDTSLWEIILDYDNSDIFLKSKASTDA